MDTDFGVNKNDNVAVKPAPPQSVPAIVSAPITNRPEEYNLDHETPHNRFYVIKHVLALFTGWVATGAIISSVALLVDHIFKEKDAVDAWLSFKGFAYTALLSTLIVFGVVYVVLFLLERDKSALPTEKNLRHGRTLTTIFAVALFATSISYIASFIFPLIGNAFGLMDIEGRDIAKTMITSAVGIAIPFIFAAYHIEAFAKIKKFIFSIAVSAIIFVIALMIVILPASDVRSAVKDQKIVDDLEQIETAISKYASSNSTLPKDLKQITVKDLKGNITDYDYKVSSKSSSRYTYEYEICAYFATDTLDDDDAYSSTSTMSSYSFRYHKKGKHCFTREQYASSNNSINSYYDF